MTTPIKQGLVATPPFVEEYHCKTSGMATVFQDQIWHRAPPVVRGIPHHSLGLFQTDHPGTGEREGEGVGEIHTCGYWRERVGGGWRDTHMWVLERESGRGLERYTHVGTGEREWEGVGEIHTCGYWRESGRGLERNTHVRTGERGEGVGEIHTCE